MANLIIKVEGLDGLAKAVTLFAEALTKSTTGINVKSASPEEDQKMQIESFGVEVPVTEEVKGIFQTEEKSVEHSISLEDIQKAFKEKATPENKRHMQEIMQGYGAQKLSQVPPEKYPELLKHLELVQ